MKMKIAVIILAICLIGATGWGFISYNNGVQAQNTTSKQGQVINELDGICRQMADEIEALKTERDEHYEELAFVKSLIYLQEDEYRERMDKLEQEKDELLGQLAGQLVDCESNRLVATNMREFRSVEELTAWLAIDPTSENKYIPYESVANPGFVCWDFAMMLYRNALSDGYLMFVTFEERGDVGHLLNVCVIGNDVYLIEPQHDTIQWYGHWD